MSNFINDILNNDDYVSNPITDDLSLIDADTVRQKDNSNIRLRGGDAPEVPSFQMDSGGDLDLKRGSAPGIALSNLVYDLIKEDNFTTPVETEQRDKFGRIIGDMTNDKGESLSRKMLAHNMLTPTGYSSPEDISIFLKGKYDRLMREREGKQTNWDRSADEYESIFSAYSSKSLKPLAIDEAQYARNPDLYSGVSFRRGDRTIMNRPKNLLATAWTLGTTGMQEGYFGAMEILGEALDNENLAHYSRAKQATYQQEIQDLPELENVSAFDEDGNWTIDGIAEFGEYLLTNTAISAPYMLQSILAVALAKPTLGASLAFPAATYIGQTYNDQSEDNKSALAAITSGIAQTALDYAGVKIVGGTANFFSKEGRKKIVKDIAKAKNIPEKEAEKLLSQNYRNALKDVTNVAKSEAAKEIALSNKLKGLGKATTVGAVGEGLTETAQELLQYVGSLPEEYNKDEIKSRVLNALVAGGTLGGAFGTASGVSNYIGITNELQKGEAATKQANKDLEVNQAINEAEGENAATKFNQSRTLLDEANSVLSYEDDFSLNTLEAPERNKREKMGAIKKTFEYFKNKGLVGGFSQGFIPNLFRNYNFEQHPTMVKLAGILGGNNALAGEDPEVAIQVEKSNLDTLFFTEGQAMSLFGINNTQKISDIIYSAEKYITAYLNRGINTNGDAFWSKISEKMPIELQKYSGELKAVADKLQNLENARSQGELRPNAGFILRRRSFNKNKIEKNKSIFIRKIAEKFNVSSKVATGIANQILESGQVNEFSDLTETGLFTDIGFFEDKADAATTRTISNEIKVSEEFNEFLDNNLFYNIVSGNASSAIKKINNQFFGKDGRKIGRILKLAESKGEVTAEEVAYLSAELKDYLDMRQSLYGRIQNETINKIQSTLLFFTTLNQLPLATLSSLVELALSTRLLNPDQIQKLIKPAARAAAQETANYINEGASKIGVPRKEYLDTEAGARNLLLQTGFADQSNNARLRAGADTASNRQNQLLNGFFKLILLQGFTNFSRTLRLAIFGDYLIDKLNIIEAGRNNNETNTNEYLDAQEQLLRYGVNIDLFLDKKEIIEMLAEGEVDLNNPLISELSNNFKGAAIEFVDDAVAHPRVGNRPKYYNDKRFAILTSFQGFIGTFTATILPQIYKGLGSRTIGGKADSIKTIALLIAMGYFAQALRDMIKYGEEPEWLDDEDKFQRAVYSSGLLGSYERLYDIYDPLYPQSGKNIVEDAGILLEGEMPSLSFASRIADVVQDGIAGDAGAVAEGLVRVAPITGPLYKTGKAAEDAVNQALYGDN